MNGSLPVGVPDWRSLRTLIGPADFVPTVIDRLLTATTDDEASTAYWELDNRVVVQGQLFEAAEAVAHELVTRICSGGLDTRTVQGPRPSRGVCIRRGGCF